MECYDLEIAHQSELVMNYTPVVWKMLMLMMRRDKRALLKKREKISLDISAIRERLEGVSEKEYKIKLELHKLSSQLNEMKDEEAELNEYKHVRTESCGSCVGDGDAGGVVDVHGPAHDGERVGEGGRDGERVVSAAAGCHVHLREDQEGDGAAEGEEGGGECDREEDRGCEAASGLRERVRRRMVRVASRQGGVEGGADGGCEGALQFVSRRWC